MKHKTVRCTYKLVSTKSQEAAILHQYTSEHIPIKVGRTYGGKVLENLFKNSRINSLGLSEDASFLLLEVEIRETCNSSLIAAQ